jgi:SAM-dependent methyltransferase
MEKTIGTWRINIERLAPTNAELVNMYDQAAAQWQHRLSWLGYPDAYAGLIARLRQDGRLARLGKNGRMLDCGIGTAALSLPLARSVGGRWHIDGVDISRQMLVQAQQTLRYTGGRLRLHQADAACLPFANETFDLVTCAHLLEHLHEPPAGLQEMVRVLRPGAPLLVIITRRCFLDRLHRYRWRYRPIEPICLEKWLAALGIKESHPYELRANRSLVSWQSIAYWGIK